MLDSKPFWTFVNLGAIVFWLGALYLLLTGQQGHVIVLIAALFLVVHVLELPVAFRLLRRRGFPAATIFIMTMIYGFTWWLPAQRGVHQAG